MNGAGIEGLKVGDWAATSKTISESDVYLFAGITGDFNPAHVDEEYAKNTIFKGRIAHGMLVAGLLSSVLGMKLPGPETIYLRQSLKFLAPTRIGDTVTARVEILSVDRTRNRVTLKTTCTNQSGVLIVDGEAEVSLPRAKAAPTVSAPS